MNYYFITNEIKNKFILDSHLDDSNKMNKFFLYLEALLNKKIWDSDDFELIILLIENGIGNALNNFFCTYNNSNWKNLGFSEPTNIESITESSSSGSLCNLLIDNDAISQSQESYQLSPDELSMLAPETPKVNILIYQN